MLATFLAWFQVILNGVNWYLVLYMTLVIAITFIVLYVTSKRVRYYSKFAYFIVVSLAGATLPIPLMLLRPRDSRNALLPAWGLRMLSKFMGLRYVIRGQEHIVKNSGCVVLINHQSALDLIVLAELWPIMDRCTVISKKEVLYLGPFGWATWLWGTIFIDRLNSEKAQQAINTTGTMIREQQSRVLMFPEGTRNGELELLPFKKGAFHLAIASRCPIQPVVVSNYYFLNSTDHEFGGGEVEIQILPAISTADLTRNDLSTIMSKTREHMLEKYLKLSKEVVTRNGHKSKFQ